MASLSVSKRHIVCSEILSVTSAMRKNARWASGARIYTAKDDGLATSLGLRRAGAISENQHNGVRGEAQLMAGFLELRREVLDKDDVSLLNLFTPFLALIRSPLSTGPITATALSALHTFFLSDFVTKDAPSLEIVLAELSNAVSHCKFEASDASGDEVVLLRIMAVIKECMCCEAGDRLGDIEVCEMLETVLTTCCQMRLSEILRQSAESTMHALIRRIFHRLQKLDPVEEEKRLVVNVETPAEGEVKMNVQSIHEIAQLDQEAVHNPEQNPEAEKNVEQEGAPAAEEPAPNTEPPPENAAIPQTEALVQRADYGLPSIVELLRVLINILDPNDRLHTDSTRLTALRILNTAFEVSGSHISAYPSLMSLIQDRGCKFLFQLARSDNPYMLHMALRVITTMFETMRAHLKLQQELFLAFTVDRLTPTVLSKAQLNALEQQRFNGSPRPGTPVPASPHPGTPQDPEAESENTGSLRPAVAPAKGETRELMLETLHHLAQHPSFMVDLYVNYDCDINCEDLFDRLVDFLCKGVYRLPSVNSRDPPQQPAQSLCLDMLLDFIKHMLSRNVVWSEKWPEDFPDPEELQNSKSRKRLVLTGASRFNTKPKVGLSFLEENKLIYSDLSDGLTRAQSLAKFLKGCTRLDKRLLGDFISRSENFDVLKAFVGLFDFKDKPIHEAMRELLETFRLPGEAQQIARITETFAEIYFASQPAEIKSQDAVHVLAYSIILLNTDQHNPQIRRRMTFEDYQRNVRGVNDGSDFPADYLKNIYDSIRKSEIVLPEEHTGQLGFEYAWKELLARSRLTGKFTSCNTALFDKAMFLATWKQVIAAVAYAFTTFDDDYTVQRAISGLRECATLAGCFDLPEVIDYIVISLSQSSGLIPDSLVTSIPTYPVVKIEDQDLTISTLSVKFGTNFKGQLAAVVLFAIANANANAIREGWTYIFEIFQNLFSHSLLPARIMQMEDFLGGTLAIPLKGGGPPPRQTTRGDGGLLSALSSYLMAPYSEVTIPEATEAEIETTLCTVDCLAACRLEELYGQITSLGQPAVVACVRALEALAHERTVARLQQESDDPAVGSPRRNTPTGTLSYDPASMYLLETMVSIAAKTPQYIDETWPVIFEHLSALLSSAVRYSALLIERAVVDLWRLCFILTKKPAMRDQLYLSLDLLGSLPQPVVISVGEQVMSGVVTLVKSYREVIISQTEWALVFALMRMAMAQPEASRQSFDLLLSLTTEGPEQCVHSDNFVGIVNLLDEFASAAGAVAERERKEKRGSNTQSPQDAVIQRGRKAIETLFELKSFLPQLLEKGPLASGQAWTHYALPLIASFGRQSTNACRDVRHLALINLQRLLLGHQFTTSTGGQEQAEVIFNRVVFPLIDELLRPQVFQRDPLGMPETRLRASALLCKVFMQYEVSDAAKDTDIRVLWIQVLDLLDRLMNVDKRDQLHEAIPESLKNVVLVMNASGDLIPPSPEDHRTERQRALWAATHERIERFLPGFLNELIPLPPPKSKPAVAPEVTVSPSPEGAAS